MIDILGLSIWFFVKIGFLIIMLMYLVFAVVVVRQVYLMTTTIKTGFEFPVRSLAWAHLLVSLGLLVFALLVL